MAEVKRTDALIHLVAVSPADPATSSQTLEGYTHTVEHWHAKKGRGSPELEPAQASVVGSMQGMMNEWSGVQHNDDHGGGPKIEKGKQDHLQVGGQLELSVSRGTKRVHSLDHTWERR